MAPELANVKSAQLVRALERAGFEVKRQTGSHLIMCKAGLRRPITIPMHPRDLPPGTVRAIIREAGLTIEEFLGLV